VRRPRTSGLTLIEMMVVLAVILIVAAAAGFGYASQRERQRLLGAAVDLHALVHSARQTALATGRQIVVMVFPDTVVGTSVGRLLVWEQDQDFDFFDDAAPTSFESFNPISTPPYAGGEVLATLELPAGITFGPPTGYGGTAPLPSPIPLESDCTFCLGADRRGAIAFDSAGTPTFHMGNGAGGVLNDDVFAFGVSLSLMSAEAREMKVLLVTAPTGGVQTLSFELPVAP